jgi:hypothetical protein
MARDIIIILQTGSQRVYCQYSSILCTIVANSESRITMPNLLVVTNTTILQIGVNYLIRSFGGEYGERGNYIH